MSQEYEPLLKLINIHMFSARHSCRASNALTFPALLCIDYPSRYRSPFRDICVIYWLLSDHSLCSWESRFRISSRHFLLIFYLFCCLSVLSISFRSSIVFVRSIIFIVSVWFRLFLQICRWVSIRVFSELCDVAYVRIHITVPHISVRVSSCWLLTDNLRIAHEAELCLFIFTSVFIIYYYYNNSI